MPREGTIKILFIEDSVSTSSDATTILNSAVQLPSFVRTTSFDIFSGSSPGDEDTAVLCLELSNDKVLKQSDRIVLL